MSKRDYYDILGVNKDASDDDIKRSYRRLAKKYHPDVSKEDNAEEKFKEVQEAYDALGDPQKRAAYDRFGHAGANANFGGFEGFGGGFDDFTDIFSSFFGGGGTRQRNPNAPLKGRDIERRMVVDFEEAVLGTTKDLKIDVEENCHVCEGTGAKSKSDVETCRTCHGRGFVEVDQNVLFGTVRTQQTCQTCNGRGKTIKNRCTHCRGSGREKVTKDVTVKVPAGIDNNMNLRMTGFGEGGLNGGPNGDLYLRFKVKPHKVFVRDRDNILLDVPISFAQAALGDKIDIPTIYGDVEVTIPAGTQPGTILRLRNKGVKNVNSSRKGDQLLTIKVEVPKTLNDEQKEALKAFSDLEGTQTPWERFKNFFKN